MQIIQIKNFNNFVDKNTVKNKIVLHGTAGGTAQGAISWLNGPAGKGVAVHYVIGEDAKIYQLFPESKFAYHAGSNFRTISETSFGIEIVNWLNLTKKGDNYYSWTNKKIDKTRVKQINNPWRGYKYFHTITSQQHQAIQYLLKYLCQKYGIKKKFYRNYDPKGEFNTKQFTGILQHSSFHPTKMDFEPTIIPVISI